MILFSSKHAYLKTFLQYPCLYEHKDMFTGLYMYIILYWTVPRNYTESRERYDFNHICLFIIYIYIKSVFKLTTVYHRQAVYTNILRTHLKMFLLFFFFIFCNCWKHLLIFQEREHFSVWLCRIRGLTKIFLGKQEIFLLFIDNRTLLLD